MNAEQIVSANNPTSNPSQERESPARQISRGAKRKRYTNTQFVNILSGMASKENSSHRFSMALVSNDSWNHSSIASLRLSGANFRSASNRRARRIAPGA